MTTQYTAGSFTKNFSWNTSYKRLHKAIANGFSAGLEPTTRDEWRKHSNIGDKDRELIPMNFFLYSSPGANGDYLMVDRLVEEAQKPYDDQFAKLALFAFHLSNSGSWKGSKWPDGRVAGWANDLIRDHAWQAQSKGWSNGAFQDQVLKSYLKNTVVGEAVTKTKVFTNYRFMLRSAKVLNDKREDRVKFLEPWYLNAIELFWDREIFGGSLSPRSNPQAFEQAFLNKEIYKLLGCAKDQGLVFSRTVFRRYARSAVNRFEQAHAIAA
jgi:hypothetical protein